MACRQCRRTWLLSTNHRTARLLSRGSSCPQSAQHVRSHWFWRKVAYKDGIIPDEDKPPRDSKEIEMDGKPTSTGTKDAQGKANGVANGKTNHQLHDPTENDHVSRSNAA